MQDKEQFIKLVKMWEDGETHKEKLNDLYGYWDGTNYKLPADSFFNKEKRTSDNIVRQIVEAKLTATLDAQFSAAVVPKIYSFADMATINDIQAVADVLDTGLKKVLADNKSDEFKEYVARWGFILFGGSQVVWDEEKNDIIVTGIDPRDIRWNKGARKIEDMTMIAYMRQLDVAKAKQIYGRNPDGSYNIEVCEKLDQAAGERIEKKDQGNNKAVGNYSIDGDVQAAGMAFIKNTAGKGSGKIVPVVIMFIFDGTLDAPEENDTNDDLSEKQQLKMAYPNGRIVAFIPDKEKQIILDDKPAPECFKSLGNIDIFNTISFGSISDGGEVEQIAPIQERINGTRRKLRSLIGGDISSVLFDERMRGIVGDDALVNYPVQFIEGLGNFTPPVVDNGMIEKAIKLREIIEGYKQDARELARINETWMSGVQQEGVQSGDHADALNESAMASIRSVQRNFKDYFISVCEKIVSLMVHNYTDQRLIEIATGVDQKQYAMFDSQTDDQGNEQKSLKFIDEAGRIVREIKMSDDWQFKVEVSSGTDIPRSRREYSRLVDEVAMSPIMQTGNIPLIEMYLTAKDFPNRRALVDLLKKQQEQAAKNQPQGLQLLQQAASKPDLLKAWGEFIKDLAGYPKAQGASLRMLGLDGTAGTIVDLPASEVTSKSEAKDIALIAPAQISQDPKQAMFGHDQSVNLEILQHTDKPQPIPPQREIVQ